MAADEPLRVAFAVAVVAVQSSFRVGWFCGGLDGDDPYGESIVMCRSRRTRQSHRYLDGDGPAYSSVRVDLRCSTNGLRGRLSTCCQRP